jgi:hypothetical protein
MSVRELETTMSARELSEWMVYYTIEPFGPAREDFRTAQVCATVANVQGNKTKPSDFIQPFEFPKATTPEEVYDLQQNTQMALFEMLSMRGKSDGSEDVPGEGAEGIGEESPNSG